MRSAAVINNGLRRYVAYSIASGCRVLASILHRGWFLSNAVIAYVHPFVQGLFW